MSSHESPYLTLGQVAVRTGRHPELLRQWCASGRVPCQRLGGSWVMLERDLPLVESIASRRSRSRPVPSFPTGGPTRTIAAVFGDAGAAMRAADALRDRLELDPGHVGTGPLQIPASPGLSLTVAAGRVPAAAVVDARRILSAFGGRIVADLEEVRAATDMEPALADPSADAGEAAPAHGSAS